MRTPPAPVPAYVGVIVNDNLRDALSEIEEIVDANPQPYTLHNARTGATVAFPSKEAAAAFLAMEKPFEWRPM